MWFNCLFIEGCENKSRFSIGFDGLYENVVKCWIELEVGFFRVLIWVVGYLCMLIVVYFFELFWYLKRIYELEKEVGVF